VIGDLTVRIPKQHGLLYMNNSFLLLLLIHIPFALLLKQINLIATIHGWFILLMGVFIAFTDPNGRRVAYISAYIVGAEVLWRMTNADVFWEFSKYAISTIMLVYLLRIRQFKSAGPPIFYFGLLLVSMPLTFNFLPLNLARQAISFNLSGPLCLAVSVIFFSQITLDWQDWTKLSQYLVAPIIGIATIAMWQTISTEHITFTSESNFITSGGFGPSQVSAILSLGAFFLFLLATLQTSWYRRFLPLGGALALATLSALTFSRGGVYNLAAGLFVFLAFSIRNNRLRNTFILLLFFGYIVGTYSIYPKLDEFTGGMLMKRFADTQLTGRWEIMLSNLMVWQQNPLLGAGPGMAVYMGYTMIGISAGAHTEYSRLLAEHGILGLVALFLLIIMALSALRKAPQGFSRALVAGILTWVFVDMSHASMRISAIPFLFGLTNVVWSQQTQNFSNLVRKKYFPKDE